MRTIFVYFYVLTYATYISKDCISFFELRQNPNRLRTLLNE